MHLATGALNLLSINSEIRVGFSWIPDKPSRARLPVECMIAVEATQYTSHLPYQTECCLHSVCFPSLSEWF